MRFAAFFLCLSLQSALVLVAWAAPSVEALVPISSVYDDETLKVPQRIQGVSFTVCQEGSAARRCFVLTTSHVSQGRRELRLGSGPDHGPQILGRLTDNDADLEILEVPEAQVSAPLLVDDPQAEPSRRFRRVTVSQALPEVGRLQVGPELELITLKKSSATGWENPALQTAFLDAAPDRLLGALSNVLSARGLISPVEIQPGMSGSPLLRCEREQCFLAGVARSYHRFYPESRFVALMDVVSLFQHYLSGARGVLPSIPLKKSLQPAEWKMSGGVTYRKYPEGTREFSEMRRNSGGGTHGDGGGGTHGDGGDAVLLNGDYSRFKKSIPLWKGKPVVALAYELDPRAPQNEIVYADFDSLRYARALEAQGIRVTALGPESLETGLFALRLGLGYPFRNTSASGESKQTLIEVRSSPEQITVKVSTRLGGVLEMFDVRVKPQEFFPIYIVRGPQSGKEFRLDLTGLLFDLPPEWAVRAKELGMLNNANPLIQVGVVEKGFHTREWILLKSL